MIFEHLILKKSTRESLNSELVKFERKLSSNFVLFTALCAAGGTIGSPGGLGLVIFPELDTVLVFNV